MIPLYIFILGLMIGSFLNAVICRLKSNEQFIKGRSKCPKCKVSLKIRDLIPVFSFAFLKAKCRNCKKPISWQYPLVEVFTGLVFLVGYYKFLTPDLNLPTSYLAFLLFSCLLIIILVYDFKHYLILDKVSLTSFFLALSINVLLGRSFFNLIGAGCLVAGFFLLQFLVSKGKWIGGGDIRLGLVMGAMLGWPYVLVALFLAYILGALVGLVLIACKKKAWGSEMPFGTFLSLTTIITLLWGKEILEWYLFKFM